MPNWCLNKLNVSGPKDKVTQFFDDARSPDNDGEESVLSFAKIVPVPEWAEEQDWYTAHCFLWGTKWDASEPIIENDDEWDVERELTYEFMTAWSPPCEFVMRAARKYPDLEFCLKWDEPEMDFAGRMRAADGEVTEHRELQDSQFDPVGPWLFLGLSSLRQPGLDGQHEKPDVREFLAKLDPLLELSQPKEAQEEPVGSAGAALAV